MSNIANNADNPVQEFLYSFYYSDQLQESPYQNKQDITPLTDGRIIREMTLEDNRRKFIADLEVWGYKQMEDEYLDYHFNKYLGDKNKWLKKTTQLIKSQLSDLNQRSVKLYQLTYQEALNWIEEKQKDLPPSNSNKVTKIKWLGKPAEFGYLFQQLADKGFIEAPKNKEAIIYAKYARILLQLFDISESQATDVAQAIAKELNPEYGKNTLSDEGKKTFKILEKKL